MKTINSFFDFSERQIKFLTVLSLMALLLTVSNFILAYAVPSEPGTPFQVFIGEDDAKLTGLFQLDPNSAPVDSLELLPGIGKVLADRIIAYRAHTRFEKEIDITEINGIGPKLYERLRPYLKIDRP